MKKVNNVFVLLWKEHWHTTSVVGTSRILSPHENHCLKYILSCKHYIIIHNYNEVLSSNSIMKIWKEGKIMIEVTIVCTNEIFCMVSPISSLSILLWLFCLENSKYLNMFSVHRKFLKYFQWLDMMCSY